MLLTDEEIREAVGDSWQMFPMGVFHILDKAQLKKVVEHLEKHFLNVNELGIDGKWLSLKKWQSLLEEICKL